MNDKRQMRISKFLSLVLRHRPGKIGIELDEAGWTDVETLIENARTHGMTFGLEELRAVVAENDKQRFALTADGLRIRASQGHSVDVELEYEPREPPEVLYHGTVEKFLPSIRQQGLVRGARHHVHLSPDRDTATRVGQRRGRPIVIEVLAGEMHTRGITFYVSANGVWLTDAVAPEFLRFPGDGGE
jgi:putative RNA 2'-phosphotransferase